MILVIDNYDSFAHNLARYFRQLGCETRISRNDQVSLQDVETLLPEAIVLSPGPCTPAEAGISMELVREFNGIFPILGVCLGHQTIVQALGGEIVRSTRPMHGQADRMLHDSTGVLSGQPNPLSVARYHSLIARANALPETLKVNGWLADETIMAVAHKKHLTVGLQFHPESILTAGGYEILANFLRLAGLQIPESLVGMPGHPGRQVL